MSRSQVADFNARIARINDPRNTSYVDAETGMTVPKRLAKNTLSRKARRGSSVSVATMIVGMVLGALCLMVARYVRFNVMGMADAGDITTGMELGIAAALALTLGGFLGQVGFRPFVAQVAGAAMMSVAMHNLIWLFPEEFAMVYSQTYVDQVRAITEPVSLFVRGKTYTI